MNFKVVIPQEPPAKLQKMFARESASSWVLRDYLVPSTLEEVHQMIAAMGDKLGMVPRIFSWECGWKELFIVSSE